MWRAITENDLLAALNVSEKSAYESVLLDVDQPDLVPAIFAAVTAKARGRIAACRENMVGEEGTVPDGIIFDLMPLVIERLMTRLGLSVDEDRQKQVTESNRFLRDIAACNFQIEQPPVKGPDAEQGAGGAVVVRPGDRRATREKLDGLM